MIKLKPGEKIIMTKRRHKFVLIAELFMVGLILFSIFLATLYFSIFCLTWPDIATTHYRQLSDFNPNNLIIFLLSLGAIACWLVGFALFSYYYLDLWVVTDRRTIHTELKSFFSRMESSVYHDKIQDVSVDIHGILPTFLNYGEVQIQTAGGFRQFTCKQIPDPRDMKDCLLTSKQKYEDKDKNNQV